MEREIEMEGCAGVYLGRCVVCARRITPEMEAMKTTTIDESGSGAVGGAGGPECWPLVADKARMRNVLGYEDGPRAFCPAAEGRK